MRQFIDVTGKNEDEAIAKALEQLGLDRDDVSVEILERAKSGFLGLGSCPAKVRVTYGEEEEPAPVVEPVIEKTEKKVEKKPEKKEEKKAEKPAAPKKESKKESKKEPKVEKAAPAQDLGEEVDDEKSQAIRKFLAGLLAQMDSNATVKVRSEEHTSELQSR